MDLDYGREVESETAPVVEDDIYLWSPAQKDWRQMFTGIASARNVGGYVGNRYYA